MLEPPVRARLLAWGPFVLSAAVTALALRLSTREPVLAVALVLLLALSLLPGWLARRRMRGVLQSGDVRQVLAVWAPTFTRMPYPETMGPLVTAAAFASCGWVEQARIALERAERGPVWEAALEHRLFIETLLDAFEGDRDGALEKAARLAAMPMPAVGPFVRARIAGLREALAAFARAFAHRSDHGDFDRLERAARASPLVCWAMRYAAAVVAVDQGNPARARTLLAEAPAWPEASAFHDFHLELAPRVGLAG